jgi:hypothetical protein
MDGAWVSLNAEKETKIIMAWKIDVAQNIQRQVVRPAMNPPIMGPISRCQYSVLMFFFFC